MTDPTPPHRRSPFEHERDAAPDLVERVERIILDAAIASFAPDHDGSFRKQARAVVALVLEEAVRTYDDGFWYRNPDAAAIRAEAESLDWRAQVGELSDQVKALRAENARLRQRLKSIESAPRYAKLADHDLVEWMVDAARAALQEKPND
jgi:hypothetical protein